MGKARAEIEITASSQKLAAGLSAARARFSQFSESIARGTAGHVSRAWGKLKPGDTTKHAVGAFGGGLLTRGLDALSDAADGVRDFERDLMRLGISAKRTPEQLNEIRKAFRATSVATGIDSGKIAAASRVYFDKTSDASGIAGQMETFAKIAQASDSNLEDIIKTAAALQDSLDIKPGEMESVFSGLLESADAGTVAVKDMASTLPSLLAMYQKFGVKGRAGAMDMAAMYQVGAKAFGSGEQAATGMEAMMGMLQARQSQLAAAGVKVYDVNEKGTVTMRAAHDIISDIAKQKIDPRQFGKIFGENKEGRNFMEMLIRMPGLYDQVIKATEETGGVQSRFAAVTESTSGRIDAAFNRAKETIAEAFTPERIEAFADVLERVVKGLSDAANWVGDIKDYLTAKNVRINEGEQQYKDRFQSLGRDSWIDKSIMKMTGDTLGPRLREKMRIAKELETYKATGAEISAEPTTKKRQHRAIEEAYFGKSEGARNIGSRYIAAEVTQGNITHEQVAKIAAEIGNLKGAEELVKALVAAMPDAVARGMAMAPVPITQIGDNQVARSVNKSTDRARRP